MLRPVNAQEESVCKSKYRHPCQESSPMMPSRKHNANPPNRGKAFLSRQRFQPPEPKLLTCTCKALSLPKAPVRSTRAPMHRTLVSRSHSALDSTPA